MRRNMDSKTKRYYEGGAHFSFVELYTRLVNIQKTLYNDKGSTEINNNTNLSLLSLRKGNAQSKPFGNQFNKANQDVSFIKKQNDNFVKFILKNQHSNYLAFTKLKDTSNSLNHIISNNNSLQFPMQNKNQLISLRKREVSSLDKSVFFNKSIQIKNNKAISNNSNNNSIERELFLPKVNSMNKRNIKPLSLSKTNKVEKNNCSMSNDSMGNNCSISINITNDKIANKSFSKRLMLTNQLKAF